MKTLYETLKVVTKHLDLSNAQLKSFATEFQEQYDDFVLDFVFSSSNNTYSVYNGLFMTKVRNYFKDLFLKYDYLDNKLLMNTAFIYQFFIELDNKHNMHNYRVLSPFTADELLNHLNREKVLMFTKVNMKYKNIKDIGNAALFMTLTIVNFDFEIKLKDIETVMTRHGLNFMFQKGKISRTIDKGVSSTINDILYQEKLITCENLAMINFMQVFILENTCMALTSIKDDPKTIRGLNDFPSTVQSCYSDKQTLFNRKTTVNLLFPEVIVNRVSIFNIIIGNSQQFLTNMYEKSILAKTSLFLIQLTFLEVIKRYNTTLLNPKVNVNEILNFFYSPVSYGDSCSYPFISSNKCGSTYFSLNLAGLTEDRSTIVGYNNHIVDGSITQYGLTDVVERVVAIEVIDKEFADFDFSNSLVSNEIEEALNNIITVFETYSKFSKELNEFSVEMLKLESEARNNVSSYSSGETNPLLEALVKDSEFTSKYYSAPFFIMNALTSINFSCNKNLPTVKQATEPFYSIYLKHLDSTNNKIPLTFFMDASSFDQVTYLNDLLALEIKSQILLLQNFPKYYFTFPDMTKFRIMFKADESNNSYSSKPRYSFLIPSLVKMHTIAYSHHATNTDVPSTLFPILFMYSRNSFPQNMDTFMGKEYLLRTASEELMKEFPQIEMSYTYIYRLLYISKIIFNVFSRYERTSDTVFSVRLGKNLEKEVEVFNTIFRHLEYNIDITKFYDYPPKYTYFLAHSFPLTPNQSTLLKQMDVLDEVVTKKHLVNVLLNSSQPSINVSEFAEKVGKLIISNIDNLTTTISKTSMGYNLLENILHLLNVETATEENIYENKINEIVNGDKVIFKHTSTLLNL